MPDLTLQDVYDNGLPAYTLEYWIIRGLLHPIVRGRGTPREWPAEELQVANLMRRLVDAGLTVDVAALVARAHLDGRPLVKLAPGVVLAIDTDLLTQEVT
ncbi:MerR family transcriptional regulator [Nonomuraea angiospora]|uniref:MerR family transcriptional regulator n=1 Tax=Nonomuraea angiospora TaxID=46172 RepID=UPI0033DFA405